MFFRRVSSRYQQRFFRELIQYIGIFPTTWINQVLEGSVIVFIYKNYLRTTIKILRQELESELKISFRCWKKLFCFRCHNQTGNYYNLWITISINSYYLCNRLLLIMVENCRRRPYFHSSPESYIQYIEREFLIFFINQFPE